MVTLNDYLYSGDTVLRIIQKYSEALKESSIETGNTVDLFHSNFLLRMEELLIHNDFLTSQSQRIRELYKYMTDEYPFLAFTFKGRIKSLIRAEEKFNAYILKIVYEKYKDSKSFFQFFFSFLPLYVFFFFHTKTFPYIPFKKGPPSLLVRKQEGPLFITSYEKYYWISFARPSMNWLPSRRQP